MECFGVTSVGTSVPCTWHNISAANEVWPCSMHLRLVGLCVTIVRSGLRSIMFVLSCFVIRHIRRAIPSVVEYLFGTNVGNMNCSAVVNGLKGGKILLLEHFSGSPDRALQVMIKNDIG